MHVAMACETLTNSNSQMSLNPQDEIFSISLAHASGICISFYLT